MAQPDIQDVFNLIKQCHHDTNNKIEQSITGIKKEVDNLKDESENNKKKVTDLEKNIEILKQDKLKNNVKISGIPEMNIDPTTLVYNICNILDIELTDDDFVAYKTKTVNFVIIQFESYRKKSLFLRKMFEKKNLMSEEIFNDIKSNNQIYACDQLTPYFGKLYHAARQAKKDGKIHSASSRGGKIRIKITENSPFQFVFSDHEITQLLNNETSSQHNTSTSSTNNKNNSKSIVTSKQHKRKAEERNTTDNNPDKLKKINDKNNNRNRASKNTT